MKALTETQKSGIGFFLNIACGFIVVFKTGMDSFTDWLMLAWCVVCVVGCTYYVHSDVKEALKRIEEER